MKLLLGSLVLALSLSVAPAALMAQQSPTKLAGPMLAASTPTHHDTVSSH